MKVGHLAVHVKSRRLMTVVAVQGRIIRYAWFDDAKKLREAPFWAHHLTFDTDTVRARAKELGLDRREPAPAAGAGNV